MYATILFAGESTNPLYVENPTWEQIKKSILALNGRTSSTVMLIKNYEEEGREDDPKESMEISGGGENQLYICIFCSEEDNYEWELYDPSKSMEEDVEIMREFPSYIAPALCFNLNTILAVAETYARFGKRDRSSFWRGVPRLPSLSVKIESPIVEK